LFTGPEVTDPETLDVKWVDADEEGLRKFLVEEKASRGVLPAMPLPAHPPPPCGCLGAQGFNAARVEGGLVKLKKSRTAGAQLRMDSFFGIAATPDLPTLTGVKRKADEKAGKKKGGAAGGKKGAAAGGAGKKK